MKEFLKQNKRLLMTSSIVAYLVYILILTDEYATCCGFILRDYLKYQIIEMLLSIFSPFGILIFLVLLIAVFSSLKTVHTVIKKFTDK
jgi:hypothetical protein|tara:strand:+ start:348 stop:611 length:264 start_codon:yes stop_codon:yes gene_type:complete